MLVLLSPTKTMKIVDTPKYNLEIPVFIEKTKHIIEKLKSFEIDDFKKYMKVNEKIAIENVNRIKNFRFDKNGIMAIQAYDGISYKRFDVNSLSSDKLEYANKTIRVISAMYGVLKPTDSIYPYRLEMQSKISINNSKNIYDYWKDYIALQLEKDNDIIINLCSNEYTKSFLPYIKNEQKFFNCEFYISEYGKLKAQSTLVKQARGLMARFIVQNKIDDISLVKDFNLEGFEFSKSNSTQNNLVFIKQK